MRFIFLILAFSFLMGTNAEARRRWFQWLRPCTTQVYRCYTTQPKTVCTKEVPTQKLYLDKETLKRLSDWSRLVQEKVSLWVAEVGEGAFPPKEVQHLTNAIEFAENVYYKAEKGIESQDALIVYFASQAVKSAAGMNQQLQLAMNESNSKSENAQFLRELVKELDGRLPDVD